MNSPSSKSNNGFSSFNETNPILGFNSPPLTASAASSGSGFSRSRLTKGRKQTSSRNYNKSANPMDTRVAGADLGLRFDQSTSTLESSLGANGGINSSSYWGLDTGLSNVNSNDAVDRMSKLNIDKNKDCGDAKESAVDRSMVDELPNEISNVQSQGVSNVDLDLRNEMKKMDPKDPADISTENNFDRHGKMSEFGFTSKLDDVKALNVEFKATDMKSNMFSGFNRLEPRKAYVKGTRSRKKKGKLKTAIVGRSTSRDVFSLRNSSENLHTFYVSPYDEKLAGSYSRENSVTSEEASQSSESHVITSNATSDNEVSETESFMSATENSEHSCDTLGASQDSDESSTATRVFNFGSRSENSSNGNFTFAASSSGQIQLPPSTRQHKKNLPIIVIREPYASKENEIFPIDLATSSIKTKDSLKLINEQDIRHESVTGLSSIKVVEEACEKWRLRGNQAYSNGELDKAEDWYTQGINSVSENEKSRSCLKALMLCYSNRAATRISMGRMKQALGDCLMAATIDPNFLKVQVRAAHCYLAIGEIENAKKQYTKCLQSGKDNNVDMKLIAEASEGLEKTQKVLDCIEQCTDLLQRGSEALEHALKLINDALQISTCSDKLLQMKADSLFMLRRYEEVIQTLTSNETDATTSFSSGLWRSHLIIKSYFYLGRLDESLEFIKKQENAVCITQTVDITSQESTIPLADTIRELLSHKTQGNEAYISGKHSEAVDHYTAALSCYSGSRPFASICFCNRAAAYRALGQITDAIADCSLAIALDPGYLKAISRRASLYEMIRDYGQAARDLQRLVSKGGTSDKLSTMNELKQTQIQLSSVEAESRKGIPLNAYLILGVDSTASVADIKKAYRKAALRHHPDKVARSLGRGDDVDDGQWKEIVENVHKDSERLFKMIGEAYAILSNPSKRLKYDQDEEKRNESNRFTRSNSSRMAAADVQNSGGNRSQMPDSRKPYVRTQSTGSENTGSSYRYSNYS